MATPRLSMESAGLMLWWKWNVSWWLGLVGWLRKEEKREEGGGGLEERMRFEG